MTYRLIKGAKGGGKAGGGAGRTPVEDPDNIRSHAFARVIDLICEGEIEGLVNGFQSIYLDKTPLQNSDGSYNFQNVTIFTRNGTQDQGYIPGFPDVESVHDVNIKVTTSSSHTITVSDSDVNAAIVTIAIPQLTDLNTSTGDLHGTTLEYAIDVQNNGGGFVAQPTDLRSNPIDGVSGATASTPDGTYGFEGGIQWDITSTSNLSPSINYDIQYKLHSDSSWTTIKTETLSAPPYQGGPSYQDGYSYGVTPDYGTYQQIATGAFSVTNLDPDIYDVRLVKNSGDGAVTFNTLNALNYATSVIISAKTTTKYERSHRIELSGSGPWDIRLRRITDDSISSNLTNDLYFGSYTEVIDAKLRYPNSALVAAIIDSVNFQTIPVRGYDMKLMRIQVPVNYDPDTREYTGSWDGTFKIAWSNNPAWVFYDLLTNTRYGMGAFISADKVDKWALYTIGKYCDELVPDGFGGTEPRFTCNIYMQTRADAYKVMQDMASVFRGMAYWASGAVTAFQDAPSDPVLLFTPANIVGGYFNYSGSSQKARHTVALVRWNDPSNFYEQKVEYVEDANGIARYGVVETPVVATGCTSRGQAHRVGKWILFSEINETDVVIFKTGMEGARARPGMIINIADPLRAGSRMGGRVMGSTSNTVTMDAAFSLDSLQAYIIYIMMPDGTMGNFSVASGAGAVLTLAGSFSTQPDNNTIFILASTNLVPAQFRVISVVDSGAGQYEINAITHNPNKYDSVENNVVLTPLPTSGLTLDVPAVNGIQIREGLYQSATDVKVVVTAGWQSAQGGATYEVSYKVDNGNWNKLPTTAANTIDIRDAAVGYYQFKIVTISFLGRRSVPAYAEQEIFGKTALPGDVQNFSLLVASDGLAHLSWDKAVDLDVIIGGQIRIRHTPVISGADWSSTVDIGLAADGSATQATLQLVPGTYMAKFIDSSGNSSENAASITADIARLVNLNVVQFYDEAAGGFAGDKDGCFVSDDVGGLIIDGTTLFDDIPDLDAELDFLDSLGGVAAEGTYYFENTLDLGADYICNVSAAITALGYDNGSVFDLRMDNIDDWVSFDGDLVDDVNAKLYISTFTTADPTWSDYRPIFNGQFNVRGMRFKLVMTTKNSNHNIVITGLNVTVDMPDRTESLNGIASGTATKHVDFINPFRGIPVVALLPQNFSTGDTWKTSNITQTGFDVDIKDNMSNYVNRTFGYIADGYGYNN